MPSLEKFNTCKLRVGVIDAKYTCSSDPQMKLGLAKEQQNK